MLNLELGVMHNPKRKENIMDSLYNIPFDTYLRLEKTFTGKRCDAKLMSAYVKVSSYIFNHEQINLVKNNDITIVQKLLEKYRLQNPFTSLGQKEAEDCLIVLQRYIDYMQTQQKNIKVAFSSNADTTAQYNNNTKAETSMNDIRRICKKFMDFVYDNPILNDKIKNILNEPNLNEGCCKWDVRHLLKILYWNNSLNPDKSSSETVQKISTIVRQNDLFGISADSELRKWLQKCRADFKYLHDQCNSFFHDVSQTDDCAFIVTFNKIINAAPDSWKKSPYLIKLDTQVYPVPSKEHKTITGPADKNDNKTAYKDFLQRQNITNTGYITMLN